ncbi:MAG TPA: helix-turn-helix domain-containing protein [bacterium]|nr:helix-turn-helix domain-containing protein [bacterium]
MKSRAGDRFKFRPELGRRLRELRLRAGLTQQMLAVGMGSQRKGNHTVVSRLENGRMANPGIGLVADYLRACLASFADIQDVLDRYTARQTVIEVETSKALAKVREFLPAKIDRAVERFDRGIRRRAEEKREPLPVPEARVKRARNFALSQIWAKRVRRWVVGIIETRHLLPGPDNERFLQSIAVRVWSALNRSRGRRAGRRAALLERATTLRAGEEAVDLEHLQAIRDGLIEFFRQAEMAGQLDVEPQLAPDEDKPMRGFQPKPDRRQDGAAWDKAREALVAQLWEEVGKMPELAGFDSQRLLLWYSVVRQLCSAVDHQAPESEACRREIEALATNEHYVRVGRDPALVRRLAAVVIPRWEELRATLGPHPLGRVRPPR